MARRRLEGVSGSDHEGPGDLLITHEVGAGRSLGDADENLLGEGLRLVDICSGRLVLVHDVYPGGHGFSVCLITGDGVKEGDGVHGWPYSLVSCSCAPTDRGILSATYGTGRPAKTAGDGLLKEWAIVTAFDKLTFHKKLPAGVKRVLQQHPEWLSLL